MRAVIVLRPDGIARALSDTVGDEILSVLDGAREVGRAAHVEPARGTRRVLFWLARLFGGTEWTRTWRGPWRVRIARGPVVGIYPTRAEAIGAEREWLCGHVEAWGAKK